MKQADTNLSKADTVALWHAVNWMELCLKQPAEPDTDPAAMATERERLLRAKRALRKVNAIRKAQACRPTANLQEQQKSAGGTGT